jgi:hypothetical protein
MTEGLGFPHPGPLPEGEEGKGHVLCPKRQRGFLVATPAVLGRNG